MRRHTPRRLTARRIAYTLVSLAVFFCIVGIHFYENQGTRHTAVEVGFTSLSPRGVTGGSIVPASCESGFNYSTGQGTFSNVNGDGNMVYDQSGAYRHSPDMCGPSCVSYVGKQCSQGNACGLANYGYYQCDGACGNTNPLSIGVAGSSNASWGSNDTYGDWWLMNPGAPAPTCNLYISGGYEYMWYGYWGKYDQYGGGQAFSCPAGANGFSCIDVQYGWSAGQSCSDCTYARWVTCSSGYTTIQPPALTPPVAPWLYLVSSSYAYDLNGVTVYASSYACTASTNLYYVFQWYDQNGTYQGTQTTGLLGSTGVGSFTALVNQPPGTYTIYAYAIDGNGSWSLSSDPLYVTLTSVACAESNICGTVSGVLMGHSNGSGGTCSATAPTIPADYNTSCESAKNACNQVNSGVINCSGTCSATEPANPINYGTACNLTSTPNDCNKTTTSIGTGTYGCNNECVGTRPLPPPASTCAPGAPSISGPYENGAIKNFPAGYNPAGYQISAIDTSPADYQLTYYFEWSKDGVNWTGDPNLPAGSWSTLP